MFTTYPANPKILSISFNVTNANASTSERLNDNLMKDLVGHRRPILNHHQLSDPTPVSLHFNKPGYSINGVRLIPLELKRSNRGAVRKAREAHYSNTQRENIVSPTPITIYCLILYFQIFQILILYFQTRLAVRISLPFYLLYKLHCTDPGLQLGEAAPLNRLSLWTCCYLIFWHWWDLLKSCPEIIDNFSKLLKSVLPSCVSVNVVKFMALFHLA